MLAQDLQSLLKMGFLSLVIAYLGLAAFAFLLGDKLTFPAPPSSYVDSPELTKFEYGDAGRMVTLRYLPNPQSRFLILYHHGNGEDLGTIGDRLETLHRAGFAVLAWDYPGYGTSDGRPTEKNVLKVAALLLESIPQRYGFPIERILQYGRSVGGGPATWLSARYPVPGLILEGTFTSIFRVALPINPLPWDLFENKKELAKVQCPVLILHGTADETVPYDHGRELYGVAPNPKFFAWMDGGRHNNLLDAFPGTYADSINLFQKHLLQTALQP